MKLSANWTDIPVIHIPTLTRHNRLYGNNELSRLPANCVDIPVVRHQKAIQKNRLNGWGQLSRLLANCVDIPVVHHQKAIKKTSWTGRHAWWMSVFNGRATQTRRVHIDQVGLAQHRATRRATSSKFYIWRMQVQCRIPPVRIVRATRFLFS